MIRTPALAALAAAIVVVLCGGSSAVAAIKTSLPPPTSTKSATVPTGGPILPEWGEEEVLLPGEVHVPGSGAGGGSGSPVAAPTVHYAVRPACVGNTPADVNADAMCPGIDVGCPPGTFRVWVFAAPLAVPVGAPGWTRVGERCSRAEDGAAPTFPGVTLRDFQALPLPAGGATVEPPGQYVLVNMPTNVFTTSTEPVILATTVVGIPVQVRATPERWSWDFGDGTVVGPTSNPGAAYPALTNTHEYSARGTYDIVMTTYYSGEFSLDGATWYPIQGEAQVDSPPVTVQALAGSNVLVAEP